MVAYIVARFRSHDLGLDENCVNAVSIIVIVCYAVGTRLSYVLLNLESYQGHLLRMINPFRGGTSQYGGFLLSVIGLWFFIIRRRVEINRLAALALPSMLIAVAIGRLGCLANGCCFGEPTSWLGIHYPPSSRPWILYGDSALHPTQIYEAAGAVLCLTVFLSLTKKQIPLSLANASVLTLYPATRIAADIYRYYPIDHHFFGIPHNTWVSAVIMLAGVILLVVNISKMRGSSLLSFIGYRSNSYRRG